MAPRNTKTRFSIWRPSAISNLQNFNFVSKIHTRNGNLHLRTKFGLNLIIHSWDMEIMLFSKWRPSAILNYIDMWFSISAPNFALVDQDGAEIRKNDFQYGVRPPSWICKNCSFSHVTYIGVWFYISQISRWSPNIAPNKKLSCHWQTCATRL